MPNSSSRTGAVSDHGPWADRRKANGRTECMGAFQGASGYRRPRDQPAEKKMGQMARVENAGHWAPAPVNLSWESAPASLRAWMQAWTPGLPTRASPWAFKLPIAALPLFSCHGVLLLLNPARRSGHQGAQPLNKATGVCISKGRGSARRWPQAAGSGESQPFGDSFTWRHTNAFQDRILIAYMEFSPCMHRNAFRSDGWLTP